MHVSRRDLLKVGTGLPLAGLLLGAAPSTAKRFSTIQAALDGAQPGDTIEIPAGTYHESIVFPRSGEPGAPITLTSAPGARVIIDGADPNLQTSPAGRWSPTGNGTYHATVSFREGEPRLAISTWISRYQTPGSNNADRLIAAYASLGTLEGGRPRGEGSYRSHEDVFVKLADDADPNTLGLSVGRSQAVVWLNGQSHIRLRDLEVRNGGWAGVMLGAPDAECRDIQIEDVTVRNCFRGIAHGTGMGESSGFDLSVKRTRILNGKVDVWPRGGAYASGVGQWPEAGIGNDETSPWRGHGFHLGSVTNVEIADCLVSGHWDGFKIAGSKDVRVHHCTLRNLWDDGVEMESRQQENIRIFNNHMYDLNVAVSVGYDAPGPIYIYRNVAEGDHIRDGARYSVKSGEAPEGTTAENVKIYHNTFYSGNNFNVWKKFDAPGANQWSGYDFVNNIFYTAAPGHPNFLNFPNYNFRGTGPGTDCGENHWEANVYNISKPAGQLGLDWEETALTNGNAVWEAHAIDNVPERVALLGSFEIPEGASGGTELSVSADSLVEFLETIRLSENRQATFILREADIRGNNPDPILFASKENSELPPTSLKVGLEPESNAGPSSSNVAFYEAPDADTYILNDTPNDNYSSETSFAVANAGFTPFKRLGYMRFDLSEGLPNTVASAVITFRVHSVPDSTASTIELYGVSPDFVPAPGEKDYLTLPNLAEHFRRFDVKSPKTPRDFRLKQSSPAAGSASDYPIRQGWPDSIRRIPPGRGRSRGAWEVDMTLNEIGAPLSVLNQDDF